MNINLTDEEWEYIFGAILRDPGRRESERALIYDIARKFGEERHWGRNTAGYSRSAGRAAEVERMFKQYKSIC